MIPRAVPFVLCLGRGPSEKLDGDPRSWPCCGPCFSPQVRMPRTARPLLAAAAACLMGVAHVHGLVHSDARAVPAPTVALRPAPQALSASSVLQRVDGSAVKVQVSRPLPAC